MNCFVRDLSVFREGFTCLLVIPYLYFYVGNLGKNLCIHSRMRMILFMVNSRPKGVKCLDQDKMAKLLFKVPVYFQSPTRISIIFLVVFVLGTGNMYFLKKNLNGI